MGLKGDVAGLKKLRREIEDLANPKGRAQAEIARNVIREVRGVLKQEFAAGEGPYGPWDLTKQGKPALISRKLPQDFKGAVIPGGALFYGRIPWLIAHHEGHTFPARQVAANKSFLTFNARGRLIKASRALNKKGQAKRGVTQTFAKAHTVSARTLPPRPIYPTRGMPAKWSGPISRAGLAGMQAWQQRAVGGG